MKSAVLILMSVLAFAPVHNPAVDFNVAPDTGEDHEIVNAVFSFQVEQYSQENRWNVFYLALGYEGAPATDESVEAFSKHIPPVKKFVRGEYDVARIQKEKGLVLGVAEVTKGTERAREVDGFVFVLPGEAKGFRYSLIRENGKWIVKSSKATWVA